MISREIAKYSIKNLWKNKSRSFLTILSIFIGITTIFVFVSFGLGLYGYIEEITATSSANKIIVQPKGIDPTSFENFKLTENDLEEVERTRGIKKASGLSIETTKVEFRDQSKLVYLMAYDPNNPLILDVFDAEVVEGRELQGGDRGEVVLGHNYKINNKIFSRGLEINDEITIGEEEAKVIGFMEEIGNPQDDANIYLTNEYFKDLYPEDKDTFSWIIGEAEDVEEMDKVIEEVEENLREERDVEEGKESFFVQSYQGMIESYTSALDIVIGFVILIALISIVVSAVNTANTMITSVLERVREIGIIKSIGAKNSEVFTLFLFESSVLGLVGGLLGIGLGFGLSWVGGVTLESLGWSFLQPAFPPYLFIGLTLFAVLTGAISGVAPAWNASKQDPVDALRYE